MCSIRTHLIWTSNACCAKSTMTIRLFVSLLYPATVKIQSPLFRSIYFNVVPPNPIVFLSISSVRSCINNNFGDRLISDFSHDSLLFHDQYPTSAMILCWFNTCIV
eukprot:26180_1